MLFENEQVEREDGVRGEEFRGGRVRGEDQRAREECVRGVRERCGRVNGTKSKLVFGADGEGVGGRGKRRWWEGSVRGVVDAAKRD